MKFNTTYTPEISLKNTIAALAWLREQVIWQIKKIYRFTYVSAPPFLEQDSLLEVRLPSLTRPISFDAIDEYRVCTLLLTPTNWIRAMIERLDLGVGEGLWTESQSIWRDVPETPSDTITRHEIIFQTKIGADEDEVKLARAQAQQIYQIIFELAKEVWKRWQIKNIYPPSANFVTSQMMENELPNESFDNREIEFVLESDAYILEASGLRMFSGHIHQNVPPNLYDLRNHYEIILRDRVNALTIKVATIALTSNGQQLKDQLTLSGQEQFLTNPFYESLVRQSYKVLEIRFNLPRLAMALLGKGHIAEVQGGVISSEARHIREKYQIETI
ncbi:MULTISPECIES: hypothetical protein [unclassified Mycoplasma]|uniref:hypothetical protein n=1 Tax=unclassified Mycoplasma TaxID=2683645 RepID=UPI000FDD5555